MFLTSDHGNRPRPDTRIAAVNTRTAELGPVEKLTHIARSLLLIKDILSIRMSSYDASQFGAPSGTKKLRLAKNAGMQHFSWRTDTGRTETAREYGLQRDGRRSPVGSSRSGMRFGRSSDPGWSRPCGADACLPALVTEQRNFARTIR
jgi:hypothetical protein